PGAAVAADSSPAAQPASPAPGGSLFLTAEQREMLLTVATMQPPQPAEQVAEGINRACGDDDFALLCSALEHSKCWQLLGLEADPRFAAAKPWLEQLRAELLKE
ncbi:MAG: hypothetical protein AB1705_21560, partial [Verrucomicrobiota bacterium]